MEFELSERLANRLLSQVDRNSPLGMRLVEHSAFHGKMMVPSRLFEASTLDLLHTLAEMEGDHSLMLQVSAQQNMLSDPETKRNWRLHEVVQGLIAYITKDAIDGWLYRRSKDGVLLPWLVNEIRYIVPREGKPYLIIRLLANTIRAAHRDAAEDQRSHEAAMTTAILINANDVVKRTIPEMLAEQGYYKESPEFKREYEKHAERFLQFQQQFGKQFVFRKAALVTPDKHKIDLLRLKDGVTVKCVNDEETLERQFRLSANTDFWREHGITQGFDRIPLHCYLYLFHLELHQHVWVHVQNLEEYQYKPGLREKLILPQEHRDLIDILTSDINVLMEDIVEGKSGGTTILCMGAPGLGKTLTAEVYSEVVGKPLYRVHSGQLGTTAASVERTLSEILQRAARWDSILLLDEADVYIRCRDNDVQHNAIVAEFLRTLEYFNGLLFMTTNRVNDVDDAILSRCIAIIKYEAPSRDDARRLWKSLGTQFQAELSDALVERLTAVFPQASGRDIKELLKLTTRFCKSKNIPLSEDAFKACAVFRGKI
jgi:hypothetical protein